MVLASLQSALKGASNVIHSAHTKLNQFPVYQKPAGVAVNFFGGTLSMGSSKFWKGSGCTIGFILLMNYRKDTVEHRANELVRALKGKEFNQTIGKRQVTVEKVTT